MIQYYVSSLCNSDTRAVIPPSHCTCNNDRYRRTPQFLFRLKTRVLTQGVPDKICGRDQAGKVSVDVLLSLMRTIKHARLVPKLPAMEIPRSQGQDRSQTVSMQSGSSAGQYPPPWRLVQELVINEYLLHCTQSVLLLLSLNKQGLHLLRWIEAFFAYSLAVRYLHKVIILMYKFWCCHFLRNELCHFLRNSSGIMLNLCKDSTNKGVIIKESETKSSRYH